MTKTNESDDEILYNLEASFHELEEVDKPTLIDSPELKEERSTS